MGHLTAYLPCLLTAVLVLLAPPISTTTRLLSLVDRGGGFDVPKEKCPPDIRSGGSLNEVTVRSAPSLLSLTSSEIASPQSKSFYSAGSTPPSGAPLEMRLVHPSSAHGFASPRPIPRPTYDAPFDLPLTPTNSTPGSSPGFSHQASQPVKISATQTKVVNGFTISFRETRPLETPPNTPEVQLPFWAGGENPATEFLTDIFPGSAMKASPYAHSVSIAQDDVTWEGVVLKLPGKPTTLYVRGKGAETVQLRESIVALLDLAEEHLGCSAFVIALERKSPALAGLIHSLMYVSGTVVTKPPFPVASEYVLVGIEI